MTSIGLLLLAFIIAIPCKNLLSKFTRQPRVRCFECKKWIALTEFDLLICDGCQLCYHETCLADVGRCKLEKCHGAKATRPNKRRGFR
jgi:hypothetical protein